MRPVPKPRSARADAAPPDTRGRVLAVAWERIAEQGSASISLVDLARDAGVSRQTLYLLFGSRAGLFVAMVEQRDQQSNAAARLAQARNAAAPREAFEGYLRAWLEYLPQVFPVARVLAAATELGDADAQAAWESRMKLLRGGFVQMARALHETGALKSGWTPATAADWMFTMTHVDTWQRLVVEARWKPREAADRIVATLRDTLLVAA